MRQLLAASPDLSVHFAPLLRNLTALAMLEHLINADLEPTVFPDQPDSFVALEDATSTELIDAQVQTSDWLTDLGIKDEAADKEASANAARRAFTAMTTGSTPESVHQALTTIETPQAVRHLVGMLTAYDWEFVEQAKELRGYAVAKILEECENPNANIRLKALGLLGKVTEVGLFTEKIEVKQAPASDAELDQRIKDKLSKFMGVIDVIDVSSEGKVGENPDVTD